jgi:hypothetical protein
MRTATVLNRIVDAVYESRRRKAVKHISHRGHLVVRGH